MFVTRLVAFIAIFYASRSFVGLVIQRLHENYILPNGFYTFNWIVSTVMCGFVALGFAALLEDLFPRSVIKIPDDYRPIPINTYFSLYCAGLVVFALLVAPIHADFISPYVASFLGVSAR